MIRQAMGGRAAEILYYGESEGLSTGVASDLQTATRWAEAMIREFGMSDSIGQVSVRSGVMDDKVSVAAAGIVRAELDAGLALMTDSRAGLEGLVSELLAKNRLTRADLERILGEPPALRPRKKRRHHRKSLAVQPGRDRHDEALLHRLWKRVRNRG